MAISRDGALEHLAPIFDSTWNATVRGGNSHFSQTRLSRFTPKAKAMTLNCLVFDELVSEFDGHADIRVQEDKKNQMRFISVNESVLLWPKKVDGQRIKSNLMLTEHSQDLVTSQVAFEFMPKATLIVLGYWFDEESGDLKRISFMPPSRSKPEWFIDVQRPDVTVIEMGSTPKSGAPNGLRTPSGLQITVSPIQGEM